MPTDADVQDVYNITNFPFGFTTAIELDGNKEAVAKYMTKYITKDLDKIFGHYYFAGGDIKRSLPNELLRLVFSEVPTEPLTVPGINAQVKYLNINSSEELNKIMEMTQ